MPNPKRKTSKARKRKRRAHMALIPVNTNLCGQCGAPKLPHRVCENCGFYRGRDVLEKESDF